MINAQDILEHPVYHTSNQQVKDCGIKTFHHHYHIISPLLALLKAEIYLELGTFAGASLKLASTHPGLLSAISIDTYCCHSVAQVRANVGQSSAHIDQRQGLTNDREILRSLYQGKAGGFSTPQPPFVDLLFIDAGHSYADVQSDFRNYYALVRPGGIILFDDYNDPSSSEVGPAVDNLLLAYPELGVIGVLPNNCESFGNGVEYLRTHSNEFIVQKPLLPFLRAVELAPLAPQFAVVMAVHQRDNNDKLVSTLRSLQTQSYPHWKLFITGDAYGNLSELSAALREAGLTEEQVVLNNLPLACERDFMPAGEARWCVAGATAMNYSLKLLRLAGYRHNAHLDSDDCWLPEHLAKHALAYQSDQKPVIVYSSGKKTGGELFPSEDNWCYPEPGNVLHSTVSWDVTKLPFYYNTGLSRGTSPADAVMWATIKLHCNENSLPGYFCKEVTVSYTV